MQRKISGFSKRLSYFSIGATFVLIAHIVKTALENPTTLTPFPDILGYAFAVIAGRAVTIFFAPSFPKNSNPGAPDNGEITAGLILKFLMSLSAGMLTAAGAMFVFLFAI